MPRQTLDISRFDAGIIALPDPKDIPFDAASWSENVDVDTAPGRLLGRWTDADYETTPTRVLGASKIEWLEKSDGTYSVVYYQPSTDSLRKVDNFHGASPGTDTALGDFGSTARTVAMQRMNNTLHIGLGTDVDAKWFGEIGTGQFGGSAPSGFRYQNAELVPPSVFPRLYKTFSDGTYLYGIEWQGQRIYKVTLSTGAWTQSTRRFEKLQGICYKSGTDMYVFDYTGSYGVLYKISMTTLTVSETYPLDGWHSIGGTLSTNTQPSDIECTAAKVWFAMYSTAAAGHVSPASPTSGKIVFNFAIASLAAGTSFHPDNVTFLCHDGDSGAGTWNASATSLGWTPRRAFYRGSVDTEVGLLMYCYTAGAGLKQTNGSYSDPCMSIILMNESAVLDAKLNSATQRLCAIDLGGGSDNTAIGTLVYVYGGSVAIAASDQAEDSGASDMSLTNTDKIGAYYDDNFVIDAGTAWDATKWITFTVDDTIAKAGGMTWCTAARTSLNTNNVQYYAIVACDDPRGIEQTIGSVYTDSVDVAHSTFENDPQYVTYSPISLRTAASGITPGSFDVDKKYYYMISYIYDEFQESPLIPTIHRGSYFYDPSSGTVACDVTISILSSVTLSERITSINLYRAESDDALDFPETFFRLVKTIDIQENWGSDTTDSATWGNKRTYVVTDIGQHGASYEANTGIPETLETTTLNYQYSAQLLGYHFVGYVKNTLLSATKRMVVRSKQNAFDMFDWTTDFLYMPRDITAMGAYGGSLLVFAANEIYKINPQSMFIEDTYTGIGCLGPQALTETEAGLFFCDLNNMYVYDGRSISPIGDVVKFSPQTTYATPWTFYGSNYTRVVVPFIKMNSVLFCCWKDSEETIQIFVYHIPSKSWRYWTTEGTASDYIGGFQDKNGQAYISHADNLVKVAATSGTRASFMWYSQDFTFNDASQKKMIDGIQLVGTSTGSAVTISNDGGTTFAALTDHSYHDTVIVKVTGTYQTDIRTIAIVYRPLLGKSW